MKTKKTFGLVALLFAVWAFALPRAAQAAGDIRSITAVGTEDHPTYGTSDLVRSGETLKFKIRLLNRDYKAYYNGTTNANPWQLKWAGLMPEDAALALYAPKIGLTIGGRLRLASFSLDPASDGSMTYWTDMVCEYEAQPGDFAMPILLSNAAGTTSAATDISARYYLANVNSYQWRIVDTHSESDVEFYFGPQTMSPSDYPEYQANYVSSETRDWDLSQANICVETMDFDTNYADEDTASPRVWRYVSENETIATPAIEIPGGTVTNTSTVYLWTEDSSIAFMNMGGEKEYNGHKVYAMVVPAGVSSQTFKIKGAEGASGKTTTLYMASTPTNIFNASGNLIQNFVTRTIGVTKPKAPYVALSITPIATLAAQTNYQDSVGAIVVRLGGDVSKLTFPVTVKLAATLEGTGDLSAIFAAHVLGLSTTVEGVQYNNTDSTVTFASAEETEKYLYIYTLGSTKKTGTSGIKFTSVVTDSAFDTSNNQNATLFIPRNNKPQVVSVSPMADGVVSFVANQDKTVELQIADTYANLIKAEEGSGYTIKWSCDNGEDWDDITYDSANSYEWDSETQTLSFKIKYQLHSSTTAEGELVPNTTTVTVISPDGTKNTYSFDVTVAESKKINAVLVDNRDYCEGESAKITFQLSQAYAKAAWAFLVPSDADTLNCSTSGHITAGMPIPVGSKTVSATYPINMLDNGLATYKVVLATDSSDISKVAQGYGSDNLYITITNKAPTVKKGTVSMGGWTLEGGDGSTIGQNAAKGVRKVFRVEADDVAADLNATGDKAFSTKWTFYDGTSTTVITNGNPYDCSVEHTFQNAGSCRVTIQFQDKDMRQADATSWTEAYTFYVTVLDTPTVTMVSQIGTDAFLEDNLGKRNTPIMIGLSMPATESLNIGLTLQYLGGDTFGYAELSTTNVTINAGASSASQPIWIEEADGTKQTLSRGFRITATVLNVTSNADGIAWNKVYQPMEFDFTLANADPQILEPGQSMAMVTNQASMNVPVLIPWEISDIGNDISNSLRVAWTTSDGGSYVYTSDAATGVMVDTGVFTNTFSSAGTKTITLTVTDKDGGVTVRRLTYYVAPSKNVYVIPQGPYEGNGVSTLAQTYKDAANLGYGRVWADGQYSGTYTSNGAQAPFLHQYFYGTTAASTWLYAWGYKHGQTDDGTLGGMGDQSLTETGLSDGKNASVTTFYTSPNDGNLDSFFYCWINSSATADSSGGSAGDQTVVGVVLGGLSPVIGFKSTSNGGQKFTLPTEQQGDDDNIYYSDSTIEAIFAKELYPADNMGDLNADGIPDYFAIKRVWADGLLYSMAASGATASDGSESSSSGDSETATGTDLVKASAYNGDGDYWPACWKQRTTLRDWTVDGLSDSYAFTALDEIRGVHQGLNYRDEKNGAVSDMDISDAEALALNAAWKVADPEGTTWATVEDYYKTGTFTDVDGVTRAWSAENRTSPMSNDTDEDLLPDGLEYFIWYYAHIGELRADGSWWHLTGSRFDLNTLGQGEEIPAEVVAWAFNPTLKRATSIQKVTFGNKTYTIDPDDFDNDGIPDIMEITLGTSPINWDTDGDGMSDYYEVMNGLNPLDATDGSRSLTGTGNPDNDFMAWMDGGTTTVYVMCNTNDGTTAYWSFAEAPELVTPEEKEPEPGAEPAPATYLQIATVAGVNYYVAAGTAVPLAEQDGVKYLAKSLQAYTEVVDGEDAYVGGFVMLPQGLAVKSVGEASPVAATLSGAKGVRVFKYGTESDFVYVPVPLDGVTEEDVEEGEGWCVQEIVEEAPLAYIHHQVFCVAGFDPRTAWHSTTTGFVAERWNTDPEGKAGSEGDTGAAVNTVPYSSRDEFLLLRYRHEVKAMLDKQIFVAGRDRDEDAELPVADLYALTDASGHVQGAFTVAAETITLTNSQDTAGHTFYGADTDGDGIPDGWELYVNIDPNNEYDAARKNGKANTTQSVVDTLCEDSDGLTFAEEYAGTDSCNAYTNVASIYQNHPGNKDGWFNKFFPTNPYEADTDGDGITDDKEKGSHTASFWVGATEYVNTSLTFLYGTPTDDGVSRCIKGAGLNPCTVDTDLDLLPDGWEYQFAGIVFTDGTPSLGNLSAADLTSLKREDGWTPGVSVSGTEIRGGMDGTDPDDANYDWDHDGLMNYQEYLVQSLRHLRYDDAETPLMGSWMKDGTPESREFRKFLPMQTWDGDAFYAQCKAAGFGGTGAWQYRDLGYFARPANAWDRLYCSTRNKTLLTAYGDIMNSDDPRNGYRIMLPPKVQAEEDVVQASGYATTDPRRWDSDCDGMDDYYELFHGLNPLLGSASNPLATTGANTKNFEKYDCIAQLYETAGSMGLTTYISAWYNAWTGWGAIPKAENWGTVDTTTETSMFDPMKFPWMMGCPEADADGDGLRNSEESLLVNTTSPSNSHTDPTPLWYTDSTITNMASFVAQYYGLDPNIKYSDGVALQSGLLYYPWHWNVLTEFAGDGIEAFDGKSLDWMFAFEENEGYDTDHDFIPDDNELVKHVTGTSDPLMFNDPNRRQALYFPAGGNSAAVSYAGPCTRSYSSEYDLLRQFTVECWIKPECFNAEQVILERVSYYGPASQLANKGMIRANFRLGIDSVGCIYGEYENTADAAPARVKVAQPLTNAWTHVALTYDGNELALYLNEESAPAALVKGVTLQPANGVVMTAQNPQSLDKSPTGYGYEAKPTALVLGAHAVDGNGIALSSASTWDSYTSFYQGYIDEVRVWDGVRTGSEIAADVYERYTQDTVSAQRQTVFEAWQNGQRRGDKYGYGELPAELMEHFSFCQLPGAADSNDVARVPDGFTKNVIKPVSAAGRSEARFGGLYCGWWASTPVRSTVYWDAHIVPWIGNTVRHLPALDGQAADSEYWMAGYAGLWASYECGVSEFTFPNTANPYPYWIYSFERYNHWLRMESLVVEVPMAVKATNLMQCAEFDLRSDFIGTGDLLPLGAAFTLRGTDFWDGKGAVEAWEYTGADTDGDELPDWWEKLYGTVSGLDWDTVITYNGTQMPAWEAYLRDLQKGLLPGTTLVYDADYVVNLDLNENGIPDWWENLNGVFDVALKTKEDKDNDQLSNYIEYLVSEHFSKYPAFANLGKLSALKMKSLGQKTPDYFLKVGQLYLGEMFADHDFLSDAWEDKYAPTVENPQGSLSRYVYDAANDPDDDGWSNFAEARAGTAPNAIAYLGVDEMTVPEYPIPTVTMTAHYNGTQIVANNNIIVQAYRQSEMSGYPDASWSIAVIGVQEADDTGSSSTGTSGSGTTSSTAVHEKLIGRNPNSEKTLHLGPGSLIMGTLVVSLKDLAYATVDSYNGIEVSRGIGNASNAQWILGAVDRTREDSTVYGDVVAVVSNGASVVNYATLGTVNYRTGEMTIDFSKMPKSLRYYGDNSSSESSYSLVDVSNSFVKVSWTSKLAAQGFPQTVYLSDADGVDQEGNASRGRIREGKNLFIAFVDLDGDGAFTPGEPYGTVPNVDVGWHTVPAFDIELKDTDPGMVRINVKSAIAGNTFDAVNALTDRGVRKSAWDNFIPKEGEGDIGGTTFPANSTVKVKVYRYKANLTQGYNSSTFEFGEDRFVTPAFETTVDLAVHPTLTEADFLAQGKVDFDMGTLVPAWTSVGSSTRDNLTNMSYVVYIGDDQPINLRSDEPFLAFSFVNTFEAGAMPTPTVPVSPKGDVLGARPVFKWKAGTACTKDYPAFQLCVWDKAGSLVYNSGIRRMPARDSEGVYAWEAPLYSGMVTPEGKVFMTTNNYTWAVSMRDAKFDYTNVNYVKANEKLQEFRLAQNDALGTLSDYGAVPVAVRYFGPNVKISTSASSLAGIIHVQAFATPDMSGDPVAEGYVTNRTDLESNDAALVANAVIHGVPQGSCYLRAYIDTNGNNKKDDWESWGYFNHVGEDDASDVYTPKAYTLSNNSQTVPVIYMEDTDRDNDGFPDAWEMEKYNSLDGTSSATGNTYFTHVNTNLASSVAAFTKIMERVSTGTPAATISLMSAILDSSPAAVMSASLLLGEEVPTSDTSVSIDSFGTDGIKVSVKNETATGAGLMSVSPETSFTFNVVLQYATDLEGAWTDVTVGSITVPVNGTAESDATLTDALGKAVEAVRAEAGNAFFKVKVIQQ